MEKEITMSDVMDRLTVSPMFHINILNRCFDVVTLRFGFSVCLFTEKKSWYIFNLTTNKWFYYRTESDFMEVAERYLERQISHYKISLYTMD